MTDARQIVSTEQWKAATARIDNSELQAFWARPVARHMKLATFVGGLGAGDCPDGDKQPSTDADCAGSAGGDHGDVPADPAWFNSLSFHPVHCAASQGLTMEGRLLWQGPTDNRSVCDDVEIINIPDAAGRSPLHWAAMAGRIDFLNALLNDGAVVDSRDRDGRTALFSAAAFGATGAVRALLQHGADKNGADGRGLTPLHAAAAGGHLQVAVELISARADPSREAQVGATPRHVAQRQGHVEMAHLLAVAAARCGSSGVSERGALPRANGTFLPQLRCTARPTMVGSE